MNFFDAQEDARKKTRLLVLLFCLAVLSLVVLTNVLVYAITMAFVSSSESAFHIELIAQNWSLFLQTSLVVVVVIGSACLYKFFVLRQGGQAIAEALGGKPLNPDSGSAHDRMVLNVVEEMAIAAGMPVPQVYILRHETGINAFAAGNSTKNAVIGLTQACVTHLSREQLQGVIGHEFSHILNGDMRLNLRLISVLFGIVFIANLGRLMMHGSHRHTSYGTSGLMSSRGNNSSYAFLAFGLFIIGSVRHCFASLIKAAVNRQREFLADAAAVQFTRNPLAVSEALKVVGGHAAKSLVKDVHANEMSHLFFSAALEKKTKLAKSSWRDSHPPLDDRIRKLDPQWDCLLYTSDAADDLTRVVR